MFKIYEPDTDWSFECPQALSMYVILILRTKAWSSCENHTLFYMVVSGVSISLTFENNIQVLRDIEGYCGISTLRVCDPNDLRVILSSKPAITGITGLQVLSWWRWWCRWHHRNASGLDRNISKRCSNGCAIDAHSWSHLVSILTPSVVSTILNPTTFRLPTDHPAETVCDTNNSWNADSPRSPRGALSSACNNCGALRTRQVSSPRHDPFTQWSSIGIHWHVESRRIYVLLSAYGLMVSHGVSQLKTATMAPISLSYWPCSFDSQALEEFGIKEASCNLDSATSILKTKTCWNCENLWKKSVNICDWSCLVPNWAWNPPGGPGGGPPAGTPPGGPWKGLGSCGGGCLCRPTPTGWKEWVFLGADFKLPHATTLILSWSSNLSNIPLECSNTKEFIRC